LLVDIGGDNAPPPATLEFDINQSGGSSLSGAVITITYKGESQTKTADNKGLAVFYEIPQNTTINYTVTATGYNTSSGSLIIEGLDDYYVETVVMEAYIPPLPAVDTNLWSTTAANEGGFYGTFDIIIPAGVNVVYVGGGINGSIVGEPCYCSMYSNFSGKTWFSASGENSAAATNYIGVTPLKTYRITVDYGSEIDGTGGSAFIRYSQRINAVMPNLTDY
jgi:hypothetical protein